jgi:drug/metabolite transporter (DMT)-like permease
MEKPESEEKGVLWVMKSRFLLLLAALLWGGTLAAQRLSTEWLGPFSFMSLRYVLGFLSLLPIAWMECRHQKENVLAGKAPLRLPAAAAVLAILLYAGTGLQQMGIFYTTAGKAGFITCLYIVVVPLLGIPFGRPLHKFALLGCFLALVGLYFLAYPADGEALNKGDVLIFFCSLVWSVDILLVDRLAPYYNGFALVTWEFFFAAIYNAITAFLLSETVTLAAVRAVALPLIYCGVFGGGIAYSFQFIGQRDVPPAEASLILSGETVFSALSGWIFLDEVMNARELWGSALMIAGILTAQVRHR